MRIRQVPVDQVRPHPANPRRSHDVDRIAASIREFGFNQPLVVWEGDGYLMVGHGRLLAAKQLGLDKVPVHLVGADELTAAQAAAYRIMDNKSAEGSEWDETLLLAQLDELISLGADPDLAGFEDAEVDALRRIVEEMASDERDPSEDDAPELPERPVSRLNDLWILGDHLLWRDREAARNPAGSVLAANRSVGKVIADDLADWSSAWVLFGGDVAYTWSGSCANLITSGGALIKTGFELRSQIIWRKQHFVISRGNYHGQHENCWYAVRKGRKSHWRGDRTQSTVWDAANACAFGGSTEGEVKTIHSTQKPVEVMRRPMINNSNQGDLVYDPFVGAFTTGIAAESCGRRCRAIEIDPAYVDVGVLRWQTFTGKEAVLEATGQSFAEVAEERNAGAFCKAV